MKFIPALLGFVCCGAACASSSSITPAQVVTQIDRQGAKAYLASLNQSSVEKILDGIGSGQTAWVTLAPRLAKGADGAGAEGLGIALAYALPKNASAVLKAADLLDGDGHILAVSRVCGFPFIDEAPPGYKAKALRAVSAVNDPSLEQKRARCLDGLKKS